MRGKPFAPVYAIQCPQRVSTKSASLFISNASVSVWPASASQRSCRLEGLGLARARAVEDAAGRVLQVVHHLVHEDRHLGRRRSGPALRQEDGAGRVVVERDDAERRRRTAFRAVAQPAHPLGIGELDPRQRGRGGRAELVGHPGGDGGGQVGDRQAARRPVGGRGGAGAGEGHGEDERSRAGAAAPGAFREVETSHLLVPRPARDIARRRNIGPWPSRRGRSLRKSGIKRS